VLHDTGRGVSCGLYASLKASEEAKQRTGSREFETDGIATEKACEAK